MAKAATAKIDFDKDLLEAGSSTALDAVAQAGPKAVALVDAWVAGANAAAVAIVAERGTGPVRKAARRGLNVLGARGVSIPQQNRVAKIHREMEEVVEAWMIPPDSTGTQLFAIDARTPTSRGRVTLIVLHSASGILRVDNRRLSQSGLRDYLQSVLPGAGYSAVRVPVEWARYRIAEARKRHEETNVPEPMGFSTAEDLISPAPTTEPGHPFDEEGLELSDEDAREMAKNSAALHRLPEFRGWLPSQASMQELLLGVGKKLTPGETPDPAVVTGYLQEEIDSATDRYFAPQVRERLVAQLKDSALSILAREDEQRALELAAVMKATLASGLITEPPHTIPFLRGFFEKAVSMMLAQGGGRLRLPIPSAPLEEAPPAPLDDAGGTEETASATATESAPPAEAESAPDKET